MKQHKVNKVTCIHCGHKDSKEKFTNQAINHHEGDELISLEIRVNVCPVCEKQDAIEGDSERCRRADEF